VCLHNLGVTLCWGCGDHLFQMDFIQWIYTFHPFWLPSISDGIHTVDIHIPSLLDGCVQALQENWGPSISDGIHTVDIHIPSLLDGCVQALQENCSVLDGYPKANRRDLHWRVLELYEKPRRSTLSPIDLWSIRSYGLMSILNTPSTDSQSTYLLVGHDRSLESVKIN